MQPSADALAGDWQHINLLPTLVLTAWHHKKLAPELSSMSMEQIAGEARKFASREYLHALYKGDRLTAEERTKAIANLSRLTGLSKAFVTANELRIAADRFAAELLRAGPQDARVPGYAGTRASRPRPAEADEASSPRRQSISRLSRLAPISRPRTRGTCGRTSRTTPTRTPCTT